MSETQDQQQNQENVSTPQACCDGGSCCPSGSTHSGQRGKLIAFVVIVVAAGAVLANSLVRKSRVTAGQSEGTFAAMPMDNCCESASLTSVATETTNTVETDTAEGDTETLASSLWQTELVSLASLNQVASDADAVFVLLSSSSQRAGKGITRGVEAAVAKIRANKTRVSTFWLKESAPQYASLAQQAGTLPCVLAMVKGGGMGIVSDDISEAKVVQAFVTASRPASSCCPSGGPCQ
jgi:hypothetical protein